MAVAMRTGKFAGPHDAKELGHRALTTVALFREELRTASIDLAHAGAKYGAFANLRRPLSRDQLQGRIDTLSELEEVAREFTYREQLLIWAIRDEAEFGPEPLGEDIHTTKIETEVRGGLGVAFGDENVFIRWICSCGAEGPWGHALSAKVSREGAEKGALNHVANARAQED